jgi:hypothetical protein
MQGWKEFSGTLGREKCSEGMCNFTPPAHLLGPLGLLRVDLVN